MLRIHINLLALIIIILLGCRKEKEEKVVEDPNRYLSAIGILGKWEINNRTINGITLMTTVCCEFIEFKEDGNNMNRSGTLTYEDPSRKIKGTFTLNKTLDTIEFIFTGFSQVSELKISGNDIRLSYANNGDVIIDDWIRIK